MSAAQSQPSGEGKNGPSVFGGAPKRNHNREAVLALADGNIFRGTAIGVEREVVAGEAVFNTVLSGYQEVLTDPSYAGQVITFTYPHIGNYGINEADYESGMPCCAGVIVRDLARRPSSWRSEHSLDEFLRKHELSGIAEVDTRRLTRRLRDVGSLGCAFGTADEATLLEAARSAATTDGKDLAGMVSTNVPYRVDSESPLRVVAYDFGMKRTILHKLSRIAAVEVVPANTSAADVLARKPDGVFLSNGPGDPAAVTYATRNIEALLDQVPIFGICLGHQLLATALGATTHKLPFGHHGGNHPVRNEATGHVEITSQNHNYAVMPGSLANAQITHINLNDGVIEGIAAPDVRAFSVQYHPEAGPGPHDAGYLFDQFETLMKESR